MNRSITFIRLLIVILAILIVTTHKIAVSNTFDLLNIGSSMVLGLALGLAILGLDSLIKRIDLKTVNIVVLGLFFGYLLGQGIILTISNVVDLGNGPLNSEAVSLVKGIIFLLTSYLGMITVARAADEIYLSIPFLKLQPISLKKRDLLLDISLLADTRILDLANSGLIDNHAVLPQFIISYLQGIAENPQELQQNKARRSLDVIKKLEEIPDFNLRKIDTDFPEIKDITHKLLHLARMVDSNILTADTTLIEEIPHEGVRLINIHSLSTALKPLAQTGEYLQIKVQRYGKEPRQGVGYLEDRTMVVINGGAEFIGKTIKAQVLSVKHTASGRMVFCNAAEDSEVCDENELEPSPKNYFALQCDSGNR